jgi:hypothetical protein
MTVTSNQNIPPQSRTIDGLSIRYAESESRDDHALQLGWRRRASSPIARSTDARL